MLSPSPNVANSLANQLGKMTSAANGGDFCLFLKSRVRIAFTSRQTRYNDWVGLYVRIYSQTEHEPIGCNTMAIRYTTTQYGGHRESIWMRAR